MDTHNYKAPKFSLEGSLALVTGGTKGIGLAVAEGLVHAGSDVVLIGRDVKVGSQAASELAQFGHRVEYMQVDVKDEAQVTQLLDSIIRKFDRPPDILINNAGKNIRKPLTEYTLTDWDDVMDTNLRGIFLVGRECIRRMLEHNQTGKVINMSSILGTVGMPSQTAYAASKGGIEQLTKVWALEYAQYGINVNAIAPAYIRTPMTEAWLQDPVRYEEIISRTPARRLGETKDVIGAAIYLASEAADFVHGHILYIDGGWLAQ